MESLRVERLDHFGLIASVIKDLRFIEMIGHPSFLRTHPSICYFMRASMRTCSTALNSAVRSMRSLAMAVICCLANWP